MVKKAKSKVSSKKELNSSKKATDKVKSSKKAQVKPSTTSQPNNISANHPHHPMQRHLIELDVAKTRNDEEKFFAKFSGTQTSAITILILASSFLVQGITKYLEAVGKIKEMRPWVFIIIVTIFFLVSSALFMAIDAIILPLKVKKKMNRSAFTTYIIGFVFFLIALIYLLFII